jgi:catechol 2,3-dioxygenase-like lactoylglutathione lyase family enzyme
MADETTGPAEAPGRARMTQPLEAGVVVRDLEVMERFYAEALGCVPVDRSRIPQAIAGPAGLGGQLLVVWLEVPSGGRIKLIQPRASAVSFPSAVPLSGRCGLAYLTFHVDDIAPLSPCCRLPVPGRCRRRSWCRRAVGGSVSGLIRRATVWSLWTGVAAVSKPVESCP